MKKYFKQIKSEHTDKTQLSKNELGENELWQEFIANITPLKARNRQVNISATGNSLEIKTSLTLNAGNLTSPHEKTKAAYFDNPVLSHGAGAGLDSQSARKMRRGKVAIQARLDLHGMIQTEAHKFLLRFLERSYISGKKTVLVITGKGLSQNGEIGVLRQVVPRWLNEQPMLSWIRGFGHAAPTDGGVGALYVLLRKKQ